eukprot:1033739-Pelagomonas_calceolata.AAC.4
MAPLHFPRSLIHGPGTASCELSTPPSASYQRHSMPVGMGMGSSSPQHRPPSPPPEDPHTSPRNLSGSGAAQAATAAASSGSHPGTSAVWHSPHPLHSPQQQALSEQALQVQQQQQRSSGADHGGACMCSVVQEALVSTPAVRTRSYAVCTKLSTCAFYHLFLHPHVMMGCGFRLGFTTLTHTYIHTYTKSHTTDSPHLQMSTSSTNTAIHNVASLPTNTGSGAPLNTSASNLSNIGFTQVAPALQAMGSPRPSTGGGPHGTPPGGGGGGRMVVPEGEAKRAFALLRVVVPEGKAKRAMSHGA